MAGNPVSGTIRSQLCVCFVSLFLYTEQMQNHARALDNEHHAFSTSQEPARLDVALDEILFAESKDAVLGKLPTHE